MVKTHLLPKHLGKEVTHISCLTSQGLARIQGRLEIQTLDRSLFHTAPYMAEGTVAV